MSHRHSCRYACCSAPFNASAPPPPLPPPSGMVHDHPHDGPRHSLRRFTSVYGGCPRSIETPRLSSIEANSINGTMMSNLDRCRDIYIDGMVLPGCWTFRPNSIVEAFEDDMVSPIPLCQRKPAYEVGKRKILFFAPKKLCNRGKDFAISCYAGTRYHVTAFHCLPQTCDDVVPRVNTA